MRRLRTDCERREQHLQAVDLLQLQVLEVWTAPGHDVVEPPAFVGEPRKARHHERWRVRSRRRLFLIVAFILLVRLQVHRVARQVEAEPGGVARCAARKADAAMRTAAVNPDWGR
jgi:hypothetical protein